MWHEQQKQETIRIFSDITSTSLSDLPCICMKHHKDKFGVITQTDIQQKTWTIIDRDTHAVYVFKTLDELVENGWIID